MDLNQQISYLTSHDEFSYKLPLLKQVISELDIVPNYPIILVGGTNGKGSICAYLTMMLTLGGYKVGTFTSPHVFNYNERICINNQAISDDNLTMILNQVINVSADNLGLFKTFTLAAHLYFIQQKIDIAIIEVGIGGLYDPTNLFDPTISVISTIGLDHCQLLGNTIDLIGKQKSAIFRPNKTAFIGMKNPPESVIQYAKQIAAPLQILELNYGYTRHELSFDVWSNNIHYYGIPTPAMRGLEQLNNASLAIAVLGELKDKFPISLSTIKTAMLQTKLVGRFNILAGQPRIIFDVAHNPEAVSNMLKNMLKLPFAKYNYAVFGIAGDKDIRGIVQLAKGHFTKWFIAPINSKRGISNDNLIQIIKISGVNSQQIVAHETIKEAFSHAKSISSNDDTIVCFGSFLVIEEAYKCN